MGKIWVIFAAFLITINQITSARHNGDRTASLSEWENLVSMAARSHKSIEKRGIYGEPEDEIVDIQEHYRSAFNKLDEKPRQRHHVAGIQSHDQEDMGDIAEPVYGRYIVSLESTLTNRDLYHTVAILEDAYTNSGGNLVAKHIKPFHNIGKGFTATLGKKVIALVSPVAGVDGFHVYMCIHVF